LLRRSQFVNKAGIAQVCSGFSTRALGISTEIKIGALRKKQARQLIILNLLFFDRSMQNMKRKVDAIMPQVSKLKKLEN
jgi:hypothetical protein